MVKIIISLFLEINEFFLILIIIVFFCLRVVFLVFLFCKSLFEGLIIIVINLYDFFLFFLIIKISEGLFLLCVISIFVNCIFCFINEMF